MECRVLDILLLLNMADMQGLSCVQNKICTQETYLINMLRVACVYPRRPSETKRLDTKIYTGKIFLQMYFLQIYNQSTYYGL